MLVAGLPDGAEGTVLMLHSTVTAADKRAALPRALAAGDLLRMPGAFNPLSAALIQDKGFEGVYISGAVLSADLGLPDIGLTTLTEVAQRGGQIARVTDLPTLIDADTGFGEPMNVARTVQVLEDAGICRHAPRGPGQPEALRPPRRQGGRRRGHGAQAHPRGGRRASRPELPHHGAHRHPRASTGLPAAIDRAKALHGRRSRRDLPRGDGVPGGVRGRPRGGDVPILANMTEFGKSELFTTQQLADVGVNIVIFPVSLLRLAMGAAERGLDTILAEGSLTSKVPEMQTRARLYELLDYESYSAFDAGIFTFDLRQQQERCMTDIKKGLAGVVVDTTSVSKVNPETNSLLYRGYPVQELASTQPFEAGRLPALARRAARPTTSWPSSSRPSGRSARSTPTSRRCST